MTFYSYVNKDAENRPPYWAAVDEQTFTEETATILKSYKDTKNPDIVSFPVNMKSAFKFKNAGEQLCFVMAVDYASTTGIQTVENNRKVRTDAWYNLNGQRVGKNTRGIIISQGRKFVNR